MVILIWLYTKHQTWNNSSTDQQTSNGCIVAVCYKPPTVSVEKQSLKAEIFAILSAMQTLLHNIQLRQYGTQLNTATNDKPHTNSIAKDDRYTMQYSSPCIECIHSFIHIRMKTSWQTANSDITCIYIGQQQTKMPWREIWPVVKL